MRHHPIRILVGTAVTAAVVTASAGTAAAQTSEIATAAQALRQDPVYVSPAARSQFSQAAEANLERQIRDEGTRAVVAVLPSSAGNPDDVPVAIGEAMGYQGTIAAVTGGSFRVASNTLPRGAAGQLATQAYQANPRSVEGTLSEFVRRVDRTESGASTNVAPRPNASPGVAQRTPVRQQDNPSPLGGLGLLGILALLGALAYILVKRRKKKEQQRRFEQAKRQLQVDVDTVSNNILNLEAEVQLNDAAREDYQQGIAHFQGVEQALQNARSEEDLVPIRKSLVNSAYEMGSARARLEGREPPPHPDEQAAILAQQQQQLQEQQAGQPVPVGAGTMMGGGGFGGGFGGFGGYYGGGFGGGGLLTGLMLGQMMGGFGHGGFGHGGYTEVNNYYGDGDGGGWDSGGGGWDTGGGGGWDLGGGGDFGGGDFGGGDFGGD